MNELGAIRLVWLLGGLLAVALAAVALLLAQRRRAPLVPEPRADEACVRPAQDRETRDLAQLAAAVADMNPDALVLYTEAGAILYANTAARELFFEGRDPCGQNFLRLAGLAPTPIARALLGPSDSLFTLEVQQNQETFHLSRHAHELSGAEVTLLVVRNLTREISRREVATLKNVVRVISHEVNNSLAPITSLVGSGRLIAERPEHAAKLASVFDTIEDRAKHLQAFLAGYAGLARLPEPRPAAVAWAPFLERLRALYPSLRVTHSTPQAGWFDAVQFEQVLINLIKNAREAGSAEEEIELRVSEDADGASRVEVLDRGRGFGAEGLASAFMPFYTTKANGSGMGHALSREIVHAHGGTIGLANREGGGAQVTVTLPGHEVPKGANLSRSRAKLTLSRT